MRHDLSVFGDSFDLFDPFFNDSFFNVEKGPRQEFLKCDVIENEKDYELIFDVPGISKENISIDVEDGNLTITASKSTSSDENKKNFVRKERHSFQAQRSFYVGNIKEEDIKAKMENGELHINVPKEESPVITKKTITIE